MERDRGIHRVEEALRRLRESPLVREPGGDAGAPPCPPPEALERWRRGELARTCRRWRGQEVAPAARDPAGRGNRSSGRSPRRRSIRAPATWRRRDVSKRHGRPSARPAAAEVIVDGSRKRRPERHGA
jgi:hypothetical protein